MDRIFKLTVCSIVIFSGFACNVANTDKSKFQIIEPIDFSTYLQDSTQIIGSWAWVRTTYYYTTDEKPSNETPGSTNSTQMLVIKNSGEIEFYQDNGLQRTQSMNQYLENKLWGILADTLAISAAHVDGPESVYIRSE